MSHIKEIRDTAITVLNNACIIDNKVTHSNIIPADAKELPKINVHIDTTNGTNTANNANMFDTDIELTIDMLDSAESDEQLADTLSEYLEKVMNTLFGSLKIARLAKLESYKSTTEPNIAGHKRLGLTQLVISYSYKEEFAYDLSAENDLDEIHIKQKHAGKIATETIITNGD